MSNYVFKQVVNHFIYALGPGESQILWSFLRFFGAVTFVSDSQKKKKKKKNQMLLTPPLFLSSERHQSFTRSGHQAIGTNSSFIETF